MVFYYLLELFRWAAGWTSPGRNRSRKDRHSSRLGSDSLSMRRWFLSFNSQDVGLATEFKTALSLRDSRAHIFFAPQGLRAGRYWQPTLAEEIAQATAFILLVGEKGLGSWQVLEYYEALDKRVRTPDFPIVIIMLEGQKAPGLPFLRQLQWIVTPDPASEHSLVQVMYAVAGQDTQR